MAKKKFKQPKNSGIKVKKTTKQLNLPKFLTNDIFFVGLSLVLAVVYYSYSFVSTGFHQHDGAAHFLTMRGIWEEPYKLLSSHKSTGFYLLYLIPAKFGLTTTKIWGALIAASTCFLTYKIAKHINKNIAFLAFFFLATQHWWVNFTFRTHVEVATAFVFILAAFFHQKEKYVPAGIVFGFLGAMRPEMYIIGFGYFLYLALKKKKYVAALAVGTFPLFFNVAGFLYTGKPLFLIDSLLGGPGAGTWSKAGFDHYFKFLSEIHGGVVITLMVAFLGATILTKKWKDEYYIIVIPAFAYFLMQCIFNLQAFPIGPYTGGTARYIILLSPFLAVMAAVGVSLVEEIIPKWKLLIFLLPLAVGTGIFLSYFMANAMITEQRDWYSTVTIAITSGLILLPASILKRQHKYFAYAGLAVLSAYFTIKPYTIDFELSTLKESAEWYNQEYGTTNGPYLYTNHTLFYYFLGKASEEIEPTPQNIIKEEQMQQAPKGSIVFWDSHYGYRPNKANFELQYTYFTERPQEYALRKQFVSPNQRFVVLAFEKL